MTKQTIEIDVPEGYEVDERYIKFNTGCYPANMYIGLKKKPPRRRIFECVSEEPRHVQKGDWFETSFGDILIWKLDAQTPEKFKIFKEVTDD